MITQIEKFDNVIRVLEAIPADRVEGFGMESWSTLDIGVKCGTIKCVAGHCGSDPWFNNQNFYLTVNSITKYGGIQYTSNKLKYINFQAVQEFFKLNYEDSYFLFGDNENENSTLDEIIQNFKNFRDDLKQLIGL